MELHMVENRDASPKMQEVKFNYQNITAQVSADSDECDQQKSVCKYGHI